MTTVNAPQWVNREIFAGLLKINYTEFENITKFECTAAISGGENYLTIVLRIRIEMLMKGRSATRSYMFVHVMNSRRKSQCKFTEHFINR